VAGLELHVGLGVAGGRLVRERRVAEVVPGPERLLDPGAGKRRPHVGPRQLARVEGGAERRVAFFGGATSPEARVAIAYVNDAA
jgi:hypothetical protein